MVLFVGRHGIPPWPKQSNGDVAEKAYRANRCYQGEWKTPIPQVTSSTEGRSEVPVISVQNSPRSGRLRPLPRPRSADIRKLGTPAARRTS
jgi:hypothetical protein